MNDKEVPTIGSLDVQMQHIARDITTAAKNSRIEFDDMLQEARIGGWLGLQGGAERGAMRKMGQNKHYMYCMANKK